MEGRTENWKGHCALSPDQEQGQPLEREKEREYMDDYTFDLYLNGQLF